VENRINSFEAVKIASQLTNNSQPVKTVKAVKQKKRPVPVKTF
jgi:hypothetical protein